jgi:hypothetical protein
MSGRILVGDIKGPPGDPGPTGPPGTSGANALFNGSDYAVEPGAINYVGPQDPVITLGSVPDGSVWFDTS